MGIKALPNTTVRALGASQVLNDPASVVKELIDNALDAQATSIAIEISNNTVDHIQVRDNGHGIPPEDRALVARPHCTSKISSEDDLNVIGGSSLGFRGEAIASIAEMSSTLTISTRVEGEQVAAALKINQQGEVVGQEKASFPVGTTIKITGFVKDYPVRNQNALKNSDKCLKKIKQTLKSYAFARLHVRLSFRVLKAKNDNANWTYAPKASGNAEDAAFKILGAACASQCVWSVVEDQGFTMQAFLPKLDGDAGKVSNIGQFISVDGRPVSTLRGTPKQLAKIFRDALKKTDAKFDAIKDPFLYLEIGCPVSSYDANVEPAKDDVLFENPDLVVDLSRRLFNTVYPSVELTSPPNVSPSMILEEPPQRASSPDDDGFVTSLEPGYAVESNMGQVSGFRQSLIPDRIFDELADCPHGDSTEFQETISQRAFRPNMYGCDEEDLDLLDARPSTCRTEADFEELRQARKDVNISNPWVMARLNATRRPVHPPDGSDALADNSLRVRPEHDVRGSTLDTAHLPTPRPSSLSPVPQSFNASQRTSESQYGSDGRSIGAHGLPTPQATIQASSSAHNEFDGDASSVQRLRQRPDYDYTLSSQASEPPKGTPLSAIPFAAATSQRRQPKTSQQVHANKPFKPSLKEQPPQEKVWFDHLEDYGRGTRHSARKRKAQQQLGSVGVVQQGDLGDLSEDARPLTPPRRNRDMRDFVTRLDLTESDSAASVVEARHYPQRQRSLSEAELEEINTVELDSEYLIKYAHRPTKQSRTSGRRSLREISGNARSPGEDEDFEHITDVCAPPRRKSTNPTKSRRLKSSQLPLERVPAGHDVHHLSLVMTTTSREILQVANGIDQSRSLLTWSETGNDSYDAFTNIPPQERRHLVEKLCEVLRHRLYDGGLVQDLRALVENALDTHDG